MDIRLDRDLHCQHFEVCVLSRYTGLHLSLRTHPFIQREYKSPSVRGSSQ